MKTIRIFIGSSITDLELERFKLMSFIQGLNNKYHERGVFIEGYICEETPNTMRLGGSQEQHNDYISNESDLTVFMFFHKAGEFTLKELQLAREAFLRQGRPNVCVFFKAVNKAPDLNEDIQRAVRLVFEDYGHYYKVFEDVDTVKLEILQFLADLLPGKSELLVKDGAVFVNGEAVEGISAANVFAYRNNPDLARLKEKIDRLREQEVQAAGQGNESAALRFSKLRDDLEKEYHDLETGILDMLLFFHRENRKSGKSDPVLMEALRYLELGEIEMAKALIPQEELEKTANEVKKLRELDNLIQAKRQEKTDILLSRTKARIRILTMDTGNKNRFAEINRAYEDTYDEAVAEEDCDLIYNYARFLHGQKNYTKAILIAKKLKDIHDNRNCNGKLDDFGHAMLLNAMGRTYDSLNDPANAESMYRDALEIFQRRMQQDPSSVNEFALSIVLNNLGSFYKTHDKLDEADQYYKKALNIRRRLLDTFRSEMIETHEANTLNNLGLLYIKLNKPVEAEKCLQESLNIYRRHASITSRDTYEPYVAGICNNLAVFYKEHAKPNEAEDLLNEALTIHRRLVESVSRDVYEPDLAKTCNNLGNFYKDQGKLDEALTFYLESLEIYRLLFDTVNREAYEPEAAQLLNNLYAFYSERKPVRAEIYRAEALGIAARYKDVDPVCQRIYDGLSSIGIQPNKLDVTPSTVADYVASIEDETDHGDSGAVFHLMRPENVEWIWHDSVDLDTVLSRVSRLTGENDALSARLIRQCRMLQRALSSAKLRSRTACMLADRCARLADLMEEEGYEDEAVDLYLACLILCSRPEKDDEKEFVSDVAGCCERAADLLSGRDEEEKALPLYQHEITLLEMQHRKTGEHNDLWRLIQARYYCGGCLETMERYREAAERYLEAYNSAILLIPIVEQARDMSRLCYTAYERCRARS
ncbi:MAG: tetratricopeptide repeat protein [Clostridia bacterium]|nr:tetratricopeptide repeat protein [Clostridia bacterium]